MNCRFSNDGPHQVQRPQVSCLNEQRIVQEPLTWVVKFDVVQDVITRPVDVGTQTQTRSCQLVCGYQYYSLALRAVLLSPLCTILGSKSHSSLNVQGLILTRKNLRSNFFYNSENFEPSIILEKSKKLGPTFWSSLVARFLKMISKNF